MYVYGQGGEVDFAEARRLLGLAVAQNNADAQVMLGKMHFNGQGGPVDLVEAGRLLNLAAAQNHDGVRHALDVVNQAAEARRAKAEAAADAMMKQLLAEEEEEKKAKGAAKSKKSANGKKHGSAALPSAAASEAPATASSSGTVAVRAAASNAAQRDAIPTATSESLEKSTKGAKGKKGKKKRGEPTGSTATSADTAAALESFEAQAVPETISVAPSPTEEHTAAHLSAPELVAPSSEARAAEPVPVAAATFDERPEAGRAGRDPSSPGGGGGHEQVPSAAATATSDDAVGAVAHLLDQASFQVPAGSSEACAAEPVAAAAPVALNSLPPPPTAITVSLADAHFNTGRLEAPESTIGGQTTCIVCFVNPKSHAAVPCGHQCACADCSAQMTECPVCRKTALMWMQVRMA
jgi:hypothetical protein